MGSKYKVTLAFLLVAAVTFAALELFMSPSSGPDVPLTEEAVAFPGAGSSIPRAGNEKTTAEEPAPAARAAEPQLVPVVPRGPVSMRKEARLPVPPSESEPGLTAVYMVKDTTPPRLSILSPVDRSYTMERQIKLTVRSEAGARVDLNGSALAEKPPGFFRGSAGLSPGQNSIVVRATDAVGNVSTALARVTFIDPANIRAEKSRLVALLKQLDEVRAAARDVDQRIAELLGQIEDAKDVKRIPEFSNILREVRNNRKQLQQEIEHAIVKIDKSLPGVK
ncbi:MAG TPA: hypothetical protein VM425_10405 [Myxococcota bacterium]|nr:hypothetical protein [Myxococcota bacterium]